MTAGKYLKIFSLTLSMAYVSYLTYLSALWRVDSHHDGYVYLSAILATEGYLPPIVTNHHGIGSAMIEGRILSLTSTSLFGYRLIGLFVIFVTAFLIYKIIALRLDNRSAFIFSLLWLAANPSWVASLKQIPTGIQSIWPNLWIQLFTLLALYFIISKRIILSASQIIIGIIIGTLPFFRIQGLVISFILLIYLLIYYQKLIPLVSISLGGTLLGWLSLIANNGGIKKYLENILFDPLTKQDYAEFITLNSILLNFANKFKYYVVICIIFLILSSLLIIVKTLIQHKTVSFSYSIFSLLLLCLLAAATLKNIDIWVDTLYIHATTLLIDLSLPIAVLYLGYKSQKYFFKDKQHPNFQSGITILLAFIVIANFFNQFPLSDRGHKWWSAAPSVIFLAYMSHQKLSTKSIKVNKLNIKKFTRSLIIMTVVLSIIEGRAFQQIARTKIQNFQILNFNGMVYPSIDAELVSNLIKSIEILEQLEINKVKISYVCEDGLYYVRSKGTSASAVKGLGKNTEITTPQKDSIIFICHSSRRNYLNSIRSNIVNVYTIGQTVTDLFIVNKNSDINLTIENLIR